MSLFVQKWCEHVLYVGTEVQYCLGTCRGHIQSFNIKEPHLVDNRSRKGQKNESLVKNRKTRQEQDNRTD